VGGDVVDVKFLQGAGELGAGSLTQELLLEGGFTVRFEDRVSIGVKGQGAAVATAEVA
jgi:hypothetical protein